MMNRRIVFVAVLVLLVLNMMPSLAPSSYGSGSIPETSNSKDAFVAPDLPSQFPRGLDALSPTPSYYETSEYLIGSVAVGIIFLESNGTIDPSTESWVSTHESEVVSEIRGGLSWFANYKFDAHVGFVYDIHYGVPTKYEPIKHPMTYQQYWISEAMTYLGYSGTNYFTQVRDYVNGLRDAIGTDWAFTIFVVDSYYDSDGKFSDGHSAYAYLGGPFLVLTYDNDGYGIGNMDWVCAHETGHIFYATDEYDNVLEYSGYLNALDTKYTTSCLMGQPTSFLWWIFLPWSICVNSQLQLGWRDIDSDGIQDILDTFPDTILNPYVPDPTDKSTLTYTGVVAEIPYPNNNPHGTGRDITTNVVKNVQFRVDTSTWLNALSKDGNFDEAQESFEFNTSLLAAGSHTVEARSINSVGNIEASYAIDEVTVSPNLFADDFESGSFSAWSGTSVSSGETATVQSATRHHGSYAARLTSNGGGGTEYAYCRKTIAPSIELYARGYFYTSQSGIIENNDRFYFLMFTAGSNNVAYAGWRKTNGVVKWFLTIRNGTSIVTAYSAAVPVVGRWYCVELHWKKDSVNGLGELWVDGTRVCSLTGRNTATYGDVNQARFGLAELSYCASTTVYGDCVKIARSYVGPEPFEDSFESGNFNAWSGSTRSSGETTSVVNTRAYRGVYSARFTSNGTGGGEYAYCYRTVASSTEVYARGYFYVSQSGIVENDDRFHLIVLMAGSNGVAFAGWRKTGGAVKWTLMIRDGTAATWPTVYSSTTPLLNRWYCVELHWKKDVASGFGELWVDGVRICSIADKNTAAYGSVSQVRFGLAALSYCASTTVYCDCAKISKAYIGLEP